MSLIDKIRTPLTKFPDLQNKLSPRTTTILLFSTIGLTQGLLSSYAILFNYLYRDTYFLSPAKATLLDACLQLPWIFKPLWIGLSSRIKPFGYRRKSFLVITTFIGWLSLLHLAASPEKLPTGGLILFTIGLSASFLTCLAEGITSEVTKFSAPVDQLSDYERHKEISKSSMLFFVTKYLGKVIGAALMTFNLQESNRAKYLFGGSLCFFSIMLISFVFPEKKENNRNKGNSMQLVDKGSIEFPEPGFYTASLEETIRGPQTQENSFSVPFLKQSLRFMLRPLAYMPILLILLNSVTLQSQQTKFYFYTQDLGFEPSFMAFLKLVEYIAILVAFVIYNGAIAKTNLRKVCLIAICVSSFFLLTEIILALKLNVGLSDKMLAIIINLLMSIATELKSFPILFLATGICPSELKATMLPILVAIESFGSLISSQIGGILTGLLGINIDNFGNFWALIVIGAIFSLSPIFPLRKIDFERALEHAEAYTELETSWTKHSESNRSTIARTMRSTIEEKLDETYEI